jgi:hypothetical protein
MVTGPTLLSWLLSERQIMREDQVGRLARALMPMAAALPQGAADLHAWLVEDGVPSWCLGRPGGRPPRARAGAVAGLVVGGD